MGTGHRATGRQGGKGRSAESARSVVPPAIENAQRAPGYATPQMHLPLPGLSRGELYAQLPTNTRGRQLQFRYGPFRALLLVAVLVLPGLLGPIARQAVVAPQHPFWLPERRAWVTAGDLKVGDELLRKDGTEEAITAISFQAGAVTVCNFTVEGDHDYFVADVDALVHNCPQDLGQGDLNDAQLQNLKRFEKSLPRKAGPVRITALPNGGVQFAADVPATNIPGS